MGRERNHRLPLGRALCPRSRPREPWCANLFEELGVFKDGKWDERRLCFAPQERLFLHGRWQEGIEPEIAATARDREDYRRFQST